MNAHGYIEDLWGKQVPELFDAKKVAAATSAQVLAAPLPAGSKLDGIVIEDTIPPLKSGDPWQETVNICRAGFALSVSLVPPSVAPVDDQTTRVTLDQVLNDGAGAFCGKQRFWDMSRAIMHDAVLSTAMFWQDVWWDFVKGDKDAKGN